MYDRCVLSSDEHKSIPLLINDDLQDTGTDFFLQRFLLAPLASREQSSYMSTANPFIWKIRYTISIKTNKVISCFSLSSIKEQNTANTFEKIRLYNFRSLFSINHLGPQQMWTWKSFWIFIDNKVLQRNFEPNFSRYLSVLSRSFLIHTSLAKSPCMILPSKVS